MERNLSDLDPEVAEIIVSSCFIFVVVLLETYTHISISKKRFNAKRNQSC